MVLSSSGGGLFDERPMTLNGVGALSFFTLTLAQVILEGRLLQQRIQGRTQPALNSTDIFLSSAYQSSSLLESSHRFCIMRLPPFSSSTYLPADSSEEYPSTVPRSGMQPLPR